MGFLKGLFFSSANAGAEFFQSKLFSAKMASIKIFKESWYDTEIQKAKGKAKYFGCWFENMSFCNG